MLLEEMKEVNTFWGAVNEFGQHIDWIASELKCFNREETDHLKEITKQLVEMSANPATNTMTNNSSAPTGVEL